LKVPKNLKNKKTTDIGFGKKIPELNNRYLRVITLEDKVTIHNAFPDRRFKP